MQSVVTMITFLNSRIPVNQNTVEVRALAEMFYNVKRKTFLPF